jgi:hypothetical protein
MKMKTEHYDQLAHAIGPLMAKHSFSDYKALNLSAKRYRWDLMSAARFNGVSGSRWICDNLYGYLNDDHIDTALRRITGTK